MNDTQKTNLQVGDKIVAYHYSTADRIITIDRVTETQAISGNIRFKREINNGHYVREIGARAFNSFRYSFGTPDELLKAGRLIGIKRLRAFDFSKLSPETLDTVLKLIGHE